MIKVNKRSCIIVALVISIILGFIVVTNNTENTVSISDTTENTTSTTEEQCNNITAFDGTFYTENDTSRLLFYDELKETCPELIDMIWKHHGKIGMITREVGETYKEYNILVPEGKICYISDEDYTNYNYTFFLNEGGCKNYDLLLDDALRFVELNCDKFLLECTVQNENIIKVDLIDSTDETYIFEIETSTGIATLIYDIESGEESFKIDVK